MEVSVIIGFGILISVLVLILCALFRRPILRLLKWERLANIGEHWVFHATRILENATIPLLLLVVSASAIGIALLVACISRFEKSEAALTGIALILGFCGIVSAVASLIVLQHVPKRILAMEDYLQELNTILRHFEKATELRMLIPATNPGQKDSIRRGLGSPEHDRHEKYLQLLEDVVEKARTVKIAMIGFKARGVNSYTERLSPENDQSLLSEGDDDWQPFPENPLLDFARRFMSDLDPGMRIAYRGQLRTHLDNISAWQEKNQVEFRLVFPENKDSIFYKSDFDPKRPLPVSLIITTRAAFIGTHIFLEDHTMLDVRGQVVYDLTHIEALRDLFDVIFARLPKLQLGSGDAGNTQE